MEYKEYTLGEVSEEISYGYTASASLDKVGPKFLRITDIREEFVNWDTVPYCDIDDSNYEKNKLESGDIVIARTGATTGINSVIREEGVGSVFASYLIRFRINTKIANPYYIGYLLKTHNWNGYVNGIIGGSAQPGANAKQFAKFKFQLPSLEKQNLIVKVLDGYSNKMQLNYSIIANLEQLAQTLFKRWFVDFEFPNENGDPYKSSGGKMVESGLGMIPVGWDIKKIGELVEFAYGKPLKKVDRVNGSYPVYGSNGIVDYHENAIVKGPGIIIGRKGNPGTVNYEKKDFFPIDTTFYVVKKDMNSSFIFIYFMLANQNLANLSADSAVPGLNRNHAYQSKFILPSNNYLEEFDNLLRPIFDRRFLLIEETDKLTALRDTLLPKLLSGEIELPEETEVTEDVPIS